MIPVPNDKEPDNDLPVSSPVPNSNRNNLNNAAKVGTGVVVGIGLYEVAKWGIAAAFAPETAGGSLVVAGAAP